VQDAIKRHAELWTIYGPAIEGSPTETHPILFKAHAKTEDDAQAIAAALRSRRYEIIAVEKTWWPPFRRWQVIGLSEPMPITRQSTEQWVRETAAFLVQSNVRLGLWRPAEKKPAA